jgi:cbb3-type cytochrome oxidase cytochrome c subunit
MKGLLPLFLGILGTFTFSWVGLTMIPNAQIGHLDPQVDEDGNDPYPAPKSGMADRGRKIYIANGCIYCHSQQVRPAYGGADLERKWGDRRSAPRDYLFEHPNLLGKMRTGPDLANIGKRAPADDANAPAPASTNSTTPGSASPAPANGAAPAAASPSAPAPAANAAASPSPAGAAPAGAAPSPAAAVAANTAEAPVAPTTTVVGGEPLLYSAAWHHRHLYAPRSVTFDSTMPAYRFLYEKREISGEVSADALHVTGKLAPPDGWEIVPTYDAKCLVAYLMSLDQSHPLKEVKSAAAPPAPAAPGKAVK